MTFGEKLKYYRKKAGLTQRELAKVANLSLNTICNYEKGNTYPKDRSVYEKLAEILDVDVDDLKNEGLRYHIGVDMKKIFLSDPINGSDLSHLISPEIVWGDPEPQLTEEQVEAIKGADDPYYRKSYRTILKNVQSQGVEQLSNHPEAYKTIHRTYSLEKIGEETLSEQFIKAMSSFFTDPQISNEHKMKALQTMQTVYLDYLHGKNNKDDKPDEE